MHLLGGMNDLGQTHILGIKNDANQTHTRTHLLGSVNDALGDSRAIDDPTKDVDKDALDLGVGVQDLEGRNHLHAKTVMLSSYSSHTK